MIEQTHEDHEAPVPLVTLVNNILHSIFFNIEMYINNQQIYNSNGLYVQNFYNSNNFKEAISEYKGIFHCEGYHYEELLDEIMEAPLFEPFFTRREKMHSRLDSFILYENMRFGFFSISDKMFRKTKNRLSLIRARPNFYMISDNINVSLGIAACSLYNGRIAVKNDQNRKRINMLAFTPVEFNYLETLAKNSSFKPDKTSFFQKKTFLQCSSSSNFHYKE